MRECGDCDIEMISFVFSRENTPGNTKESVSSNEDYFYNPDLDASFPPVQASVPPVQEQETGQNSSQDNSNNNISNNNQHNVPPHPTDSSLSETTQSSDNTTNRSKKSKLRLTKSSEPSLSLPPVVILQTTRASEPTETAGFTFGFEVSGKLSIIHVK